MKKSKLVLALAAVLPGVAFAAAAPTDFGYAISGTTVTNTCETGFTCSAPISDMGFLQVTMTEDSTGDTYFKTIIASDDGAGRVFETVSFVGSGGGTNGIALTQTLSTAVDGTVGADKSFLSTAAINTGSFLGTGDQLVLGQEVSNVTSTVASTFYTGFDFVKDNGGATTTTLTQEVVDGTLANTDAFADSFTFLQTKDAAGTSTGVAVTIVSSVQLNTVADGGTVDDQRFNFSSVTGAAAASATTPNGDFTTNDPLGVTWAANSTVERSLISQTVVGAGDFGYVSVGSMNASIGRINDFSLVGDVNESYTTGSDPFAAPGTNAALFASGVTTF